MPSKAIELMAFDVFKTVFHRDGGRPGPGGTMLSGALAGLCRCVSAHRVPVASHDCMRQSNAGGRPPVRLAVACQACTLCSQATCPSAA